MGTWHFWTFPTHSLECCTKFLSFYFAQRRLQDHFLGGMFAKFQTFFLQIFGNCKKLIVCDGLVYRETCPEICPKSLKKQRSYDNFKHLVKNDEFYFGPWTKIFGFFGFWKTDLVVHDEGNRMAFTHRSAPYGSRDLKGGRISPLTS